MERGRRAGEHPAASLPVIAPALQCWCLALSRYKRLWLGVQGANKQGISVHVKAHKKFDTAGVGLKESSARAQDWTLEMCKFSGILQGLQEVVNTSVADATANDSDDRPDKSRKSKRRKKQIKPDSDDSTDTSETAERSAKPSSVPSDAGKAAAPKLTSHAGRYAKRTRNKLVKGYSQVDLAAILGQATGERSGMY